MTWFCLMEQDVVGGVEDYCSMRVELVGMNPLPEKDRRYWARLMWYTATIHI
jgi:hypothetical protein